MSERFTYFVNGILTPLEDPRTWVYQAQLWMHDRGIGKAAGFNYSAGVIGGVLARDQFSQEIAEDLLAAQRAEMQPLVAVGHSNGCPLLLRALVKHPELKLAELHLIAAAVIEDCSFNGLNAIADSKQVDRVVLYVSSEDEVLGGSEAVGYGRLGKVGPVNVRVSLAGILERVDARCGHCDWVTRDFETTMKRIAHAALVK